MTLEELEKEGPDNKALKEITDEFVPFVNSPQEAKTVISQCIKLSKLLRINKDYWNTFRSQIAIHEDITHFGDYENIDSDSRYMEVNERLMSIGKKYENYHKKHRKKMMEEVRTYQAHQQENEIKLKELQIREKELELELLKARSRLETCANEIEA